MKFKKYTAFGMAFLMIASIPNGAFAATLTGITTTKYMTLTMILRKSFLTV